MIITADGNKTFEEIAAYYTIGGADYGPAVAYINGYRMPDDTGDPYAFPMAGENVNIPDEWAAAVTVTATPPQSAQGIPTWMLLAAAAVLLAA